MRFLQNATQNRTKLEFVFLFPFNKMSSNQNDEKVESTNDASQQHDDNDVIENETEARLVKDFQKLRVAPPSSLKSTMGAANYKIMREKCDKDWKFWKSQPMPAFDDPDPEPENSGPIEPNTPFEELRKEPLHLPEQFSWVDLDLTDDKDTMEIFDLLAKYYVEDDDGVFRFCYQIEFLRWALMPPGYRKEFHIGVRVTATNKLVGFISAIPSVSRVYDTTFPTVEINFLCVHKKLRTQRLAPVLIREVTRRVNLTGVFQAVYTAGVLLPKPIAVCRYWHRTLNPKKLIEVGFTALSKRMTMARAIKLYRVDATPKIKGLREMEKRDVKAVTLLLNSYLQKFNMANIFSEEEVEHWFTPRDRIIHCYVVEGNDGKLTDMLSFYGLPSTIIGNEKYKTLNAAYLFYCVPNKHSIQQMVAAALSLAVSLDYDVMNCLDILDYSSVLKELKFGEGDGALHYYVYNYRTKTMPPSHVGLVMM